MAELAFWQNRLQRQGVLTNDHFEYFYTTHFGLDKAFYSGKRVLAIGCGPRGSLEWATMTGLQIGIDPLADAYRQLGTQRHAMHYVACGAETLPFPNNAFEIVRSLNSLDHVDNLDQVIDEIRRVLAPRGTFLLLTDIHRHPTVLEPTAYSWDVVTKFLPELEVVAQSPYRAFVEQYLPNAQIVADRFHVMKQLNEQLSKARRQIQRNADAQTKAALKGCRWLLARNCADLSAERRVQLQLALQADDKLRTAYALNEELRLIFEKVHDREQARRFLTAWMLKVRYTRNAYLLDFLNTLVNWFEQLLNYFDKRITNGFVEGINRAIRFLISRAFGFRNFDNFRLLVLAQLSSPV